MVEDLPCGGARTRRTTVLRVNDFSEAYLNTTDNINEDNEDDEEELVNVLFVMKLVHMVFIVRMITVKIGE